MGDCAFDTCNAAMVESDGELPRKGGSCDAAEASNRSHRGDSLLPLRPVMKRQKSIILPQQEDDKDQSTSLFRIACAVACSLAFLVVWALAVIGTTAAGICISNAMYESLTGASSRLGLRVWFLMYSISCSTTLVFQTVVYGVVHRRCLMAKGAEVHDNEDDSTDTDYNGMEGNNPEQPRSKVQVSKDARRATFMLSPLSEHLLSNIFGAAGWLLGAYLACLFCHFTDQGECNEYAFVLLPLLMGTLFTFVFCGLILLGGSYVLTSYAFSGNKH